MAYTDYKVIGKCPVCGNNIFNKGKVVECSSNRYTKNEDGSFTRAEGCGFRIWKTICGKELSEATLKQLIEKGETDGKVSGFVSKRTGKTFSAKLKLREDHSIEFVFDDNAATEPQNSNTDNKSDAPDTAFNTSDSFDIDSDELPF